MTYAQAHEIILDHLRREGWDVKTVHNCKRMKVPHATSPDGDRRYYFKTQSIHVDTSPDFRLSHARSLFGDHLVLVKGWADYIIRHNV